MLHGCIPVITPHFSLPEVVGDCGLYAEPGNIEGLACHIAAVIEGEFHPPEPPRDRIMREFSAAQRERALLSLLEELLPSGQALIRPRASLARPL